MIPRWQTVFAGVAWLAHFSLALGQRAQIEQARQFDAQTNVQGTALPGSAVAPATDITIGNDAESFGVQQFLKEQERARHFRTFADISAFATNNVALSRIDEASDSFLVATLGLEYRRALPQGLQIEAGVRLSAFRYNEFRQLDFYSLDASTGLSYRLEKLGGIDLFLRYNYNGLIGEQSGDVFFQNHTVVLGAQKAVVFSQAHFAFIGGSAQLGLADPKFAERSELSAFVGYHLQPARSVEIDLLYRYGYHLYSEASRRDHNQLLSLSARYQLAKWLSISASTFGTWNRSNREVFDYDVANIGGGLTVSWSF